MPEAPSVVVKDARGDAMPGVVISFMVTNGGGTVAPTVVTTNSSGVAAVRGWTLGTVTGSNSLTAAATGLTSVTFVATGTESGITSVFLPTLGGTWGEASAINDHGVVVGWSADNTDMYGVAVRWTRTSTSAWNVVQIAEPQSRAVAVNANGTAVGVRGDRVKLWPIGGGEIDLGPGEPSGINDAETVIGMVGTSGNPQDLRAVVWRKPSGGWNLLGVNPSQNLPALSGARTVARAINNAGVIAGNVSLATGSGSYYAVRWEPLGDEWSQPIRLSGTDGFYGTAGRAINNAPQADIAGSSLTCEQCLGFGAFWPSGGSATSLESVWGGGGVGFVWGISDTRRVVGSRGSNYFEQQRAFVWWPGQASVQELGVPGYVYTRAFDINNLTPAQAVGSAENSGGKRAIVWMIP